MKNTLLETLRPEDLRYYLLPSKAQTRHIELYEQAYKTWKATWAEARTELGVTTDLPSDGFTRQTRIGAVYYGNTCIALSGFNELNFAFSASRQDSLLSSWSEQDFERLLVDGKDIMIGGYLTVAKEFRGVLHDGQKLKDIMVALCVRTLLDSGCDVMTGTMRCNRGTEKSAYASGATFISKGKMYGVEVDIVGFFKKNILNNFETFKNDWAEHLWASRVDLSSPEIKHLRIAA
jgi:hypothetical protein